MKYTILGFQQNKLIENNFDVIDALVLRVLKNMFGLSSTEKIFIEEKLYMWVNYTYISKHIPICGSKRSLMRRIEKFSKAGFIERQMMHHKKGKKGTFAFISITEKFDDLEMRDEEKEHQRGGDIDITDIPNTSQGDGDIDITGMPNSHNKDSSCNDSSCNDSSLNNVDEIYSIESYEFKLASYLKKWILKNNELANVPTDKKLRTKTGWCNDMRLLVEKDGLTVQDVKTIIDFCQKDNFWMSNILSAKKLREKKDTFIVKVKNQLKQNESSSFYEKIDNAMSDSNREFLEGRE